MGRKQSRRIRVGTVKPVNISGKMRVELTALGLDGADYDRPYRAQMHPEDARTLAAWLTHWADWVDEKQKGSSS